MRKPTTKQPSALPSGAAGGSAATCEFQVGWKSGREQWCGSTATHFRQTICLSVIKGQHHEFKPPREHYCTKHYPMAEKWCNHDRTQFRYEMGELPPNAELRDAGREASEQH